ncbi:hypothetical protein D0Z00_003265 [Geotrichum galactomycetum]|uniref:Uncharacterized protein n=1 Tax=Geotrichum galactomycetum TaxID=27317 RepID=A0ACB6V1T9_9ASCO|nr:hypothetical protein D0Z00_003265 [Geotrichum candidum]
MSYSHHLHRLAGVRAFSTSAACLKSTLDKKIPVQLLKDVPGLGVRGEVVSVTPGRMRNQLHRNNGANYVIKNVPLRIPVVSRESILERQKIEKEAKEAAEAVQREAQRIQAEKEASGRLTAQDEMLRALEKSTNLSFKINTASKSTVEATTPASDLFFLESALKSLPEVIIFQAQAQPTGYIAPHVTSQSLSARLNNLLGVEVDASTISFIVYHNKKPVQTSVIDFVGVYEVQIALASDRVLTKKLRVAPKFPIENWEQLKRPADAALPTPVAAPAAEAAKDASAADVSSAPAAEGAEAVEAESQSAPSEKTFEWENDFIANFGKKTEKK